MNQVTCARSFGSEQKNVNKKKNVSREKNKVLWTIVVINVDKVPSQKINSISVIERKKKANNSISELFSFPTYYEIDIYISVDVNYCINYYCEIFNHFGRDFKQKTILLA